MAPSLKRMAPDTIQASAAAAAGDRADQMKQQKQTVKVRNFFIPQTESDPQVLEIPESSSLLWSSVIGLGYGNI